MSGWMNGGGGRSFNGLQAWCGRGPSIGVLVGLLATVSVAATLEMPGVTLLAPFSGPARLAATANGQTVILLDVRSGAILAVDPFDPSRHREAVAAPADAEPRPVAVAVIDTGVVAAVCRAEDAWSLRTWRLRPDRPVAAVDTLQVIPLGDAAGGVDSEVDVAVSGGRDWIAVSGLPSPLDPLLRGAVAGIRIGPLTARSCPLLGADVRPVALTAGPRGELVVVERDATGRLLVAYHDAGGRGLLRLATGLTAIHDIAFSPGGERLWAVAASAGREGIWQLEAAFEKGRQAIRPMLVAELAAARAVTAPTDRAVVVAHGTPAGRVERFDVARDLGARPNRDDDGDDSDGRGLDRTGPAPSGSDRSAEPAAPGASRP